MTPAFSSARQAAAFACLLLALLLLPAIFPKSWLPPREQTYQTDIWGSGPFPWIHHAIFEEKDDIDIAFMGSSHMLRGIDTPYVQAELSRKLGRPAVVRTVAWGGAGFDALYFIAQDLLDHRKVRCLVFYDEVNIGPQRNVQGTSWFRYAENRGDLAGLPFTEQARFYLAALISMPRTLLAKVRPNFAADLSPDIPHELQAILHAPNPVTRLGSVPAQVGFNRKPDSYDFAPFVSFAPAPGARPEDVQIFSEATRAAFHFSGATLPDWQTHFARKLATLAQDHGTKLVMLHIPTTHEMRDPVIEERVCWPEFLHQDVTLLGIPAARLFTNLSEEDVLKLYSDWGHLNKNGMEYFTRVVTPTLLQIYASETHP